MARTIKRFLSRVDDVLEVVLASVIRFLFSRRGVAVLALLAAAEAYSWWHQPPQNLEVGALVPAISGTNPNDPDLERQLSELDLDAPQPVSISVDAIVGRHGDHSALVTYQGRSYRARPGTLIPQDGPPSFVITRVSCNSVEAYDWNARQSVKSSWTPPVQPELPEVTE